MKSAKDEERELDDPLTHRVGYHLRRCSSMMMADLIRTLKAVGMKPAEATALLAISRNPERSQGDIGKILDVRRANMVPPIAKLIELGLIERHHVKGKTQAVVVTAEGQRLADRIDGLIDQHEGGFQDRLTGAERAELIRILIKLRGTEPLE
jgi:DNA-binding MarR family transcriptional regulator